MVTVENDSTGNPLRLTRRRRGLALMPTMVIAIGLLVLLAVGSILTVQWYSGRLIVQEFASRLIASGLSTQELALRRHLNAAVYQAKFIASAIKSGRYQMSDPELGDFITGTIAAAPQIGGVVLAGPDGQAIRVARNISNGTYRLDQLNLAADQQLADIAAETRSHGSAYWGPPVYRELGNATYLNYRIPIQNEDTYLGFLTVAISTQALSGLSQELSDPPRNTSFTLYGRDHVLAHPQMTDGLLGLSEDEPLPLLRTFGDPVIENLSNLPTLNEAGIKAPPGATAQVAIIDGDRYLVFTRELTGYGALPIIIGGYNLASAVDAPLRLFYWAMIVALILLGVSLIAAAAMAAAISRPIRRAATGAAAIGTLDFDKVASLPASYFREINDLSQSFNAMLDGLRAFGRYVPHSLVTRLIREGRVGAGTEERDLAIMFTDIAGFTSACENMSASEVAEFINHHLALISACIEAEGGTIDKYIGDAVMAFWGAPGRVENPAESACRAAIAIQKAIAADNTKRAANGLDIVRIRIGIHMGQVIVGDIGAPNRINYTIVGDAVNSAQRLESLGKAVDPDAETIVLISSEIAQALPDEIQLTDHGTHMVKGKHTALHVYQL